MKEEIEALEKNGTLSVATLPPTKKTWAEMGVQNKIEI